MSDGRIPLLLIVLSFGAGATDAFAFLALGGIFTANMTGNLVLVGLVGRDDYLVSLVGAVVAITVFVLVLLAGFHLAQRRASPRLLLAVAAALQVGILLAWVSTGRTDDWLLVALVALSASAMALQTVVARRSAVGGGLTTTYVTGTIVSVVDDLSRGRTQYLGLRIGAIVALVAGSVAGAVSLSTVPDLGPVVPAATGCAALLLAALR